MNKILLNTLGVAGLIALFVLVFIGVYALTLAKKKLDNEARYQCATSSKYEVSDGNTIASYPVRDVYEKCLQEKGIK